ncbi:DMT family transporter [Pantoea sp. CTOTU49201]|uniref:DMT family transporter n=1 Tax=Pantoea sp. CTOTU49201 TaxID=2953855 RepID=UPI0028983AA6|nr:DMT family transporter [Pantoea sp. CTOTU49201]
MRVSTGISMKILAALSSTLMLACVKGLGGTVPVGEVIFFRSFLAMLPLLVWLRMQGNVKEGIKTSDVKGHFLRGLAGTGGMYLSYLSLLYISLADATVLNYAAPLFTVILAAIILRERVKFYRWIAVLTGFTGILVMLSGLCAFSGSSISFTSSAGVMLAIAAALCTAGASIQIRFLNKTEKPGAIAFWFAVMTALTSLFTIVAGWKMPDSRELLLLVGCGLFGGITQILLTLSLRYADASLLAPFDYTTLIWSVLIGFMFLGTLPGINTFAGASLVMAGGLFSVIGEQRQRKAATLHP